jgi:hypothetical protein
MYGSFVMQLIKDYKDVNTVNIELYKVYVFPPLNNSNNYCSFVPRL